MSGGGLASPVSGRYQQLLAPYLKRVSDDGLGRRISELLALTDFTTTLTRPLDQEAVIPSWRKEFHT